VVETPAAAHGWPFLVARGRRKGYRVLLVPEPLADSNQHGLLADVLTGEFSPSEWPRVETVAAAGIGPICCAYRTERLGQADRQGSPEQLMLDQHGRPLEILYGLICATDGVLDPAAADLDLARTEALATYRRFLADEAGFTPECSHSFPLRSMLSPASPSKLAPAAPNQYEEARPGPPPAFSPSGLSPRAAGKGPAMAVLAVLGVALAGTAWALLLRQPDGKVVSVQVEQPTDGGIECGRSEAIRFIAVLATDGEARVAFHWEDQLNDWKSKRAEVAFDRDRSREVHISRPVRINAGETLRGSISLVVDGPNSATHTIEYVLRCDEQ
jgi:hypothetical protein